MASTMHCLERIRSLLAILAFISLLAPVSAFSALKSNNYVEFRPSRTQQITHSRHQPLQFGSLAPSPLWSSVGGDDEATEKSIDDAKAKKKDETVTTRGVRKAILLVPLFMKFIVVLAIKLVTDLIVFPLLWTYRLARMTKRKLLGLVGIQVVNAKPNGTAKKSDSDGNGGEASATNTTSIPQ